MDQLDSPQWWTSSAAASGAWAAVVCVVIVVGSVVNVAVAVHWFIGRHGSSSLSSTSSVESPAIALPVADLLLCALAAPLRYAAAPPFLHSHVHTTMTTITTTSTVNLDGPTTTTASPMRAFVLNPTSPFLYTHTIPTLPPSHANSISMTSPRPKHPSTLVRLHRTPEIESPPPLTRSTDTLAFSIDLLGTPSPPVYPPAPSTPHPATIFGISSPSGPLSFYSSGHHDPQPQTQESSSPTTSSYVVPRIGDSPEEGGGGGDDGSDGGGGEANDEDTQWAVDGQTDKRSEELDIGVTADRKNTEHSKTGSGDTGRDVHAVVVASCLVSLHLVVTVAVHRVALLAHPASSMSGAPTLRSLWVPGAALVGCALISGGLVAVLHLGGNFTQHLPILGVSPLPGPNEEVSSCTLGFLIYVLTLCSLATICYMVILVAILRQQARGNRAPSASEGRGAGSLVSPHFHSSNIGDTGWAIRERENAGGADGGGGEGNVMQSYGGRGRVVRACLMVLSLIFTLFLCWALPVSMALYALVDRTSGLAPLLPYCDALTLLSGMLHPFLYGEGWSAALACFLSLRDNFGTWAYRMNLLQTHRTQVTATNNHSLGNDNRNIVARDIRRRPGCCSCMGECARTHSAPAPFSEAATFANSFPLRQNLQLDDRT
ncbi:uncharacterized protein LOC143036404 [Oratosquilla oratoria]|uniref:uncharacterized protein LOC143036404 n=1 Tax=Oratosquilla oratoria TaxID=337810 RepID=UPI003F76F1D6